MHGATQAAGERDDCLADRTRLTRKVRRQTAPIRTLTLSLVLLLGGALLRPTPAAADPESVSWINVALVGCGSESCDFNVEWWSGDWDLGVAFKLISSSGAITVMDELEPFPPICVSKSNPNGSSTECSGVPYAHVLVRVSATCGATTLQASTSSDNIGQATGVISCPPSPPPCPPLQVLQNGTCVPAYTFPPSCDEPTQVQNRDGTCRCRYAGWFLHGSGQPGQGWCYCPQRQGGTQLASCEIPSCPNNTSWIWTSGGQGSCGCPGLNNTPVGPNGPYCPAPPTIQSPAIPLCPPGYHWTAAGCQPRAGQTRLPPPGGPTAGPAGHYPAGPTTPPQVAGRVPVAPVPLVPVQPACGRGQVLVRGTCRCPVGSAWNGQSCRARLCPAGSKGFFPYCRQIAAAPAARACPPGTYGRPPNCRPLASQRVPGFKPPQKQQVPR